MSLDFLSTIGSLWLFVALAVLLIVILVLVFFSGMVKGASSRADNAPPPPPGQDPKNDPKSPSPQSKELTSTTRGPGWQSAAASFARTMAFLKNTVTGRDYRYQLPWFLVIGEPGSGKSALLAQTGVNLAPEEGSGQGSTNSPLEWRFLDKGILLGVAGNYVSAGDGVSRDEHGWTRLLKLLQNNRPRRPLDGVVLTIPASDLIGQASMEEAQLGNRAARVAELLAQAQRTLGFSFPVYVVVTKCDEVSGFASFCRELPPRAEHEIFGWSSPYNVEATFSTDWVNEAFDHLSNQMRMLQSEIFVDKNDLAHPEDVFLFPEELGRMRVPTRIYLDRLLRETAYRESFRFRGIYFTGDITEKPVTEVQLAPATMRNPMALVAVGPTAPAQGFDPAEVPTSLPPSLEEGAQMPGSWMSQIAPARARVANRYSIKSPVFLKDLFERKIFPEAGLAQPLSKIFLARTRSVLIVQLAALLITVGLFVGTTFAYRRLAQERIRTVDMLGHMLKPPPKSEQYTLLAEMVPVGNVSFKSVFLPSSLFSQVDNNITEVMIYASKTWVLSNMRGGMVDRLRTIFDAAQKIPPVDPEAPAPASVDSLPEFVQIDHFVTDLDTYEDNRKIYNDLAKPGNITEFDHIRQLLVYLYGGTTFEEVHQNGHLEKALKRAYGKEIEVSKEDRRDASQFMRDMVARTFVRWFGNSSLLLADADTLRERVGALEQGRNANYAQLKELLDLIKQTELDLRNPTFQWAGNTSVDLTSGPFRRVVYDPIKTLNNPYLNPDVFDYAVGYGNERLALLRYQLADESTAMTDGSLLDVQTPIGLSSGTKKLRLALENALNLKFMSPGESGAIRTNLSAEDRLIWHVEPLQDAIQLFVIYDRFIKEGLRGAPDRLQKTLSRIALEQLRRNVEFDIHQAQEVLPRNEVNAQGVAEDPTISEVNAFKAAVPHLNELANRSQALGFVNIRNATMQAAALQSFHLLENLDARLCKEHPYAAKGVIQASCSDRDLRRESDRANVDRNRFSWWNGKPTLSLLAYDARSASELQDQLTGQREFIKNLVQQAEPVASFLNGAVPVREEKQSRLISKWEKLVVDLKQYDGKKPGATVTSLENFILADMDRISPDSFCKDSSSTGELNEQNLDYFLQIRTDLRNAIVEQCKGLNSDEVFKSYSEISEFFNANLAGRFPFGANPQDKNAVEVSPEALKGFYDLLDRNGNQAITTLTENGAKYRESGRLALVFLNQMIALKPYAVRTGDAQPFSFDLTPHFRVNQNGGESGASEIIEWTMQIGGQIFHQGEPDHQAHWQAGYPIRLSLRWATDSIYQPFKATNDRSQPNLRVRSRSAFFEYLDRWSLLSFLNRQPAVPSELGTGVDTSNYTLKFRVLTMKDPKWTTGDAQQSGTPAIAFMNLNVSMPGTRAPIKMPAFPQAAPKLTTAN